MTIRAGREFANILTQGFEPLHFRCDHQSTIGGVAVVQWNNPNGVAANQPGIFLDVVEYEGKHAFQVMGKVHTMLPVQAEDDLQSLPVWYGNEVVRARSDLWL